MNTKKTFLEVIAQSKDDIDKLRHADIDRIELVSSIDHGGYTPSIELMEYAKQNSTVPVRVMIRYSDDSFKFKPWEEVDMIHDIKKAKEIGFEGIVIGFNDENDMPYYDKLKELIELAHPMKVTFHKAFDENPDLLTSIKELKKLGVTTVLTQGGLKPIKENYDVLKSLKNHGVQVQAGGGVDFSNVEELRHVTDSIHIGRTIRENENWKQPIDRNRLNEFIDLLK